MRLRGAVTLPSHTRRFVLFNDSSTYHRIYQRSRDCEVVSVAGAAEVSNGAVHHERLVQLREPCVHRREVFDGVCHILLTKHDVSGIAHTRIKNKLTAHEDISRTLCIDSCGAPTSSVRIPVLVDRIGPMVLPHPRSERTTNSCDTS